MHGDSPYLHTQHKQIHILILRTTNETTKQAIKRANKSIMPDKDSSTPRVFLLRHGPTEWSQSGRYTGTSDIPLLPTGEALIRSTASHIYGPGKLIEPSKLLRVFCSPRQRATRTLEILLGSETEGIDVQTTEDVTEWRYGGYEGLLTREIRALRKESGLDNEREWDIWRDGCDSHGGEAAGEVAERLDRVIGEIAEVQGEYLRDVREGKVEEGRRRDILVVAHGHILRGFVKRWLGMDLGMHVEMMLEPGGVCGLSYAHGRVEERAVLVGMALPGGGN